MTSIHESDSVPDIQTFKTFGSTAFGGDTFGGSSQHDILKQDAVLLTQELEAPDFDPDATLTSEDTLEFGHSLDVAFEDQQTRSQLELMDELQRLGVSRYLDLPQVSHTFNFHDSMNADIW